MDASKTVRLYETCLAHARADRSLRTFIGSALERYDITLMEWLMLSVVCNAPANGHSMTAVAAELEVTLPQVTSLANKLLKLGLIEQKIQLHDRRARHVFPTNRGKKIWQDVEKTLSKDFSHWMSAELGISPEDIRQYVRVAGLLAGRTV